MLLSVNYLRPFRNTNKQLLNGSIVEFLFVSQQLIDDLDPLLQRRVFIQLRGFDAVDKVRGRAVHLTRNSQVLATASGLDRE
jgi:hypothetical protein